MKIARESKTDNENNNANIWKPHLKNIVFFQISPYIILYSYEANSLVTALQSMPFGFIYHILKTLTENKFLFWKTLWQNIAFSPYLHISIFGELE